MGGQYGCQPCDTDSVGGGKKLMTKSTFIRIPLIFGNWTRMSANKMTDYRQEGHNTIHDRDKTRPLSQQPTPASEIHSASQPLRGGEREGLSSREKRPVCEADHSLSSREESAKKRLQHSTNSPPHEAVPRRIHNSSVYINSTTHMRRYRVLF